MRECMSVPTWRNDEGAGFLHMRGYSQYQFYTTIQNYDFCAQISHDLCAFRGLLSEFACKTFII